MAFNPKDLKDAKIQTVQLDVERPITFDFNALAELQEIYDDPFEALARVEGMDLKAIRAIVYAALHAGALAVGQQEHEALTIGEVGRFMSLLMANRDELGRVLDVIMSEANKFFPDVEEAEEKKPKKAAPKKATAAKKTTTKATTATK